MTASKTRKVTSLYVHVPFCAQKCAYCAFYSEASSGDLVNRYVAALTREMEMVADDLKPKTIFFGGGTPSLLNLHIGEIEFLRVGAVGIHEIKLRQAATIADEGDGLAGPGIPCGLRT